MRLGVNQIMPYEMIHYSETERTHFLDGCQEMGVRVLFPMQRFGEHGSGSPRNWSKAGSYEQHFNGSKAAATWQATMEAIVLAHKTHPALLGWCESHTYLLVLHSAPHHREMNFSPA